MSLSEVLESSSLSWKKALSWTRRRNFSTFRIAIHFFVNFDIFKWLISVKTSLIDTKLRNLVNLGKLWLCESIVANPIIYRLVPRPSRFETRQCPLYMAWVKINIYLGPRTEYALRELRYNRDSPFVSWKTTYHISMETFWTKHFSFNQIQLTGWVE